MLVVQFQESERHLLDNDLGDGRARHESNVFVGDSVRLLARHKMYEAHLTELGSNRVTTHDRLQLCYELYGFLLVWVRVVQVW